MQAIVATRLLVIVLSLVVDDVEEAELVDTLGGGNDTEPVTELLLLEELLGAVEKNCQYGIPIFVVFRCTHTGTSGSGRRTPGAQ